MHCISLGIGVYLNLFYKGQEGKVKETKTKSRDHIAKENILHSIICEN